jgi:hypothetical protein
MDAEEARLNNIERQRRFKARHRKEILAKQWHQKAMRMAHSVRHSSMAVKVYTLSDPRDEDQFPRYIGIGWSQQWKRMWEVREYSWAPWAEWFRQMDVVGIRPIERVVFGGTLPIKWKIARAVARALAAQYIIDGQKPYWARWPRWVTGEDQPVARRDHRGCVYRYSSAPENRIKLAHLAQADSRGHVWFED